MNSVEIIDTKNTLKNEVHQLISNAKKEVRMLNDSEMNRVEEIKEELRKLNGELEELEKDTQLPENINIEKNKRQMETKNFSLVAAIRNAASNKQQDELTQAVIDAGQENMRNSQTKYQGQIQIPSAEFRTITKATEGTDVVATDIYDIAQAIHDHSVLSELGCRVITGLVGDVQFLLLQQLMQLGSLRLLQLLQQLQLSLRLNLLLRDSVVLSLFQRCSWLRIQPVLKEQ